MTQEKLKALIKLLINLGKIRETIVDVLTDTDALCDETWDIICQITDCQLPLEEAFDKMKQFYDPLPDGETTDIPEIVFDPKSMQVEMIQSVDDVSVAACASVADYGTRQMGLQYRTRNGSETDLVLAEVKRGTTAILDLKEPQNTDVDVYVYRDPSATDFQEKFTVKQSDLEGGES